MKIKKTENWLKTAINKVPKGELQNKFDAITAECGISQSTLYRWINKGRVPNKLAETTITKILNN